MTLSQVSMYRVPTAAIALLLMAGCAAFGVQRPPAVTVPEIIEMSRADVPSTTIIERLQKAGTVYRVQASELATLHEEGVSDPVIDYVQTTYLDAVRADQSLEDADAWTGVDGWWYDRPFDARY